MSLINYNARISVNSLFAHSWEKTGFPARICSWITYHPQEHRRVLERSKPKGGMDRWGCSMRRTHTKLESHKGRYYAGGVEEVQIQHLCSMKTTSFIFSLPSSNDTSQIQILLFLYLLDTANKMTNVEVTNM